MLSGTNAEDLNPLDGSIVPGGLVPMDALGAELVKNWGLVDIYRPILPPAGADPEVDIQDFKSRVTPSVVTSRRIRQFLIG